MLRSIWRALADLREQLADEHHPLVDEVWQLLKECLPDGRARLYTLWQGIALRRSRERQTSALYRLRFLILKLMENWAKYTLDQRRGDVLLTNNGTEQAIGKRRIRSHSTRGFKSWAWLEGDLPDSQRQEGAKIPHRSGEFS